jgi:hypothetical protein
MRAGRTYHDYRRRDFRQPQEIDRTGREFLVLERGLRWATISGYAASVRWLCDEPVGETRPNRPSHRPEARLSICFPDN